VDCERNIGSLSPQMERGRLRYPFLKGQIYGVLTMVAPSGGEAGESIYNITERQDMQPYARGMDWEDDTRKELYV